MSQVHYRFGHLSIASVAEAMTVISSFVKVFVVKTIRIRLFTLLRTGTLALRQSCSIKFKEKYYMI